jgi:hypothetical protein
MKPAPPPFSRRSFLALGSATALCGVLPARFAFSADHAEVARVVYLRDSDKLAALDGPVDLGSLMAADALGSGDSSLGASVLLRVHGLRRDTAGPFRAISLRAFFGGSPGMEAHVWSFAMRGGAPNASPPVQMVVPVAERGGLRLFGDVVRPAADPAGKPVPEGFSVFLSLGSEASPKLRRGIYELQFPGWLDQGLVFSIDRGPAQG